MHLAWRLLLQKHHSSPGTRSGSGERKEKSRRSLVWTAGIFIDERADTIPERNAVMWTLFAIAAVVLVAFGIFAWHDVRQSALADKGN